MKICLTPKSVKLIGSYFKSQLDSVLEEGDSLNDVIKNLYNSAIDKFETKEDQAREREVILQHLSIIPQLLVSHLAESTKSFSPELLNEAMVMKGTIIEATNKENGFEDVINDMATVIGAEPIVISTNLPTVRFEAVSLIYARVTNQEAIWDEKVDGYSSNITDPKREFDFKVMGQTIKDNNPSGLRFKLMTLKDAEAISGVENNSKTQESSAPVMVLVRRDGSVAKFDANGNLSDKGKSPVFEFKTKLSQYSVQRNTYVKSLVKAGMKNKDAILMADSELNIHLTNLQDAIAKMSEGKSFMEVDVANSSVGFVELNTSTPTNISEIPNWNDTQFKVTLISQKNSSRPGLVIPFSDNILTVSNKPLDQLPESEKDFLIQLLTNNNLSIEGNPINASQREELIYNYIQKNSTDIDRARFSVVFNNKQNPNAISKVWINGEGYTISAPNVKAETAQRNVDKLINGMNNFMSTYMAQPWPYAEPSNYPIVNSIDEVTFQGQVFKSKDGTLSVARKPEISFAIGSKTSMDTSTVSKIASIDNFGNVTLKAKPIKNHIIDSGFIVAKPGGNGDIRGYGAYLAFAPVEERTSYDGAETPDLFRSLAENNKQGKVSRTEERRADKWMGLNALNDVLSVLSIDAVHEKGPSYVASFFDSSIRLWKGSNKTDIYHEAFHAYTQGLLTKAERQAMYSEVRSENKGKSFTVTVKAVEKTVEFSKATDLEIEEYLAEEFRAYAREKSKYNKDVMSRAGKFFAFLNDLFKKIFGNYSTTDVIVLNKMAPLVESIFNDLYTGNMDVSKFSTPENSVEMFQSFESGEKLGLTYAETHKVMSSMQAMLGDFINKSVNSTTNAKVNNKVAGLMMSLSTLSMSDPKYKTISDSINKEIARDIKDEILNGGASNGRGLFMLQDNDALLTYALDYMKNTFQSSLDYLALSEGITAQEDSALLRKVLDMFGDTKKNRNEFKGDDSTILGMFLNSYSSLNLSTKIFKDDLVDETVDNLAQIFDRKGNEDALHKVTDVHTEEMLSTIIDYTAQGHGVMKVNSLGIGELIPYRRVIGKISNLLDGLSDAEDMYDAMLRAGKTDHVIAQVVGRLGDIRRKGITDAEQTQWTNFWQSLNKATIKLKTLTIEKEEVSETEPAIFTVKVGKTTDKSTIITRQWKFNFEVEKTLPITDISPYSVPKGAEGPVLIPEDALLHFESAAFIPIKGDTGNEPYHLEKKDGVAYSRRVETVLSLDPAFFLRTLGIDLPSTRQINHILNQGSTEYDFPKETIGWIVSSLENRKSAVRKKDRVVESLEDLFKSFSYKKMNVSTGKMVTEKQEDLSGYLSKLASLASNLNEDYLDYMTRNAEGELQSEKSFHSSLSAEISLLNNAKHIDELTSIPGMEHFNYETDPFLAANKTFVQMFQLDKPKGSKKHGQRNEDIRFVIENLAGTKVKYKNFDNSVQDERGVSSLSSDINTKFMTDFFLTLENKQEIPRSEAKSTSLTAHGPIQKPLDKTLRHGLAIDNVETATIFTDDYNGNLLTDEFLPHLEAELIRIGRIKKAKADIKNGKSIQFDPTYLNNGEEFHMFDLLLLEKGLKEDLLALDIQDSFTISKLISPELRKRVENNLRDYFEMRALEIQQEMGDKLIIPNNITENFQLNEEESAEALKERLFKVFIVNNFLQTANYATLFLGDPAIYKSSAYQKRIAGKISTGKMMRTDASWYNFVNSEKFVMDSFAQKRAVKNGTVYSPRVYNGYLNTGVIKEAKFTSVYKEIYDQVIKTSNYENMEEADGAGWINFDTYRTLLKSHGEWSDGQEALYKKILNDEYIDETKIRNTFPMKKYQHYGPVTNEQAAKDVNLKMTAFHKYSLLPLIPGLIEDTRLEELSNRMLDEKIDYITMESGSKLSTIQVINKDGSQADNIYNEDREITSDPITLNVIHAKHLKSQVFISEGYKGYITLPSQMRKMIMLGLKSNGVPSDFMVDGKRGTKTQWDSIKTEKEKRSRSKNYDWILRYDKNIAETQKVLLEELYSDIGLSPVYNKKGKITDIKGSTKGLVDYIQTQLTNEDLLPEEVGFIIKQDGSGEMIDDLSMSLNSSKIEKILVTMVDKKLRRLKVNGEGLVQASGTMFETKLGKSGSPNEGGTNGLKTYYVKDVDGNPATYDRDTDTWSGHKKKGDLIIQKMEVKISLQGDFMNLLDLEHFDGEPIKVYETVVNKDTGKSSRRLNFKSSLARLNASIKNAEWNSKHNKMLTMTGPRIPTQEMNSLEAATVAEFLPPSSSNLIILPSEVVAKTGSDYDIDKLFLMFPNIINVNGKVKLVSHKKINESYDSLHTQIKDSYVKLKDIRDDIDKLYDDKTKLWETKEEIRSVFSEELAQIEDINKTLEANVNKVGVVYVDSSMGINEKKAEHSRLKKERLELSELRQNLRNIISKAVEQVVAETTPDETYIKAQESLDSSIKSLNSEFESIKESIDLTSEKIAQKGTAGLQNEMIDLFAERITMPSNLKDLVQANDTDTWDEIADELETKLNSAYSKSNRGSVINKDGTLTPRPSDGTYAKSSIYDYRFNLQKHQENSVGMESLGIAAVVSTYYAMFTSFGAKLKGVTTKEQDAYKEALKIVQPNSKASDKKKFEASNIIKKYRSYSIKFDHNKVSSSQGSQIALGLIENIDGQTISNIFGQLINGYVDVATDARVFNIQGNKQNTPNFLFMVMSGMKVETAIQLASLPMVREYNKLKAELEGVSSNLTDVVGENPVSSPGKILKIARGKMFEAYEDLVRVNMGQTTPPSKYIEVANTTDKIDPSSLIGFIDNKTRTFEEFVAFTHYLEIEDMSNDVTAFTQATKFDTQKMSSISDAEERQTKIKELKASENSVPNEWYELLNRTPVGRFNNDELIIALFSQYFGIRNNPIVVKKSLDLPYVKGVLPEVLRTAYKDDFLWFLYQNSLFSVNTYNDYDIKVTDNEDIELEINEKERTVTYNSTRVQEKMANIEHELHGMFPTIEHFVRYDIEHQNLLQETKDMTTDELKKIYYYADNAFTSTVTRAGILRKIALYKSDNNMAFFNFRMGMATMLMSFKRKYPDLVDRYDLISDLRVDYDSKNAKANMFLEETSDPLMVRVYSQNLKDLKNLPTEEKRNELVEFFKKFENMAILQTGMNRSAKYDLARIIDQSIFYNVVNGDNNGVDAITKSLDYSTSELGTKKVKQIKNDYLDIFDEKWKPMAEKSYKVKNKHVNLISSAFNNKGFAPQSNALSDTKVKVWTSFINAPKDLLKVESSEFFNKDGTINYDFVESIKNKKINILKQKLMATELGIQSELDSMLLKEFGIDNSGLSPLVVPKSKGQTANNISVAASSVLKAKHSIKDEVMANNSTIAIGRSTQGYNEVYNSSSEAYVETITSLYKERLAGRGTKFSKGDKVWVFGSGSGPVFKRAWSGTHTEEKWTKMVNKTFNDYHKVQIDRAISAGVESFNVGLAAGIDTLAKKYLESKGFSSMVRFTPTGKYFEMVKNYVPTIQDTHAPSNSMVSLDNLGLSFLIKDNPLVKEINSMSQEDILSSNLDTIIQADIRSKLSSLRLSDPTKRQTIIQNLIDSNDRPISSGNNTYNAYLDEYLMEARSSFIANEAVSIRNRNARRKSLVAGEGIKFVNVKFSPENVNKIKIGLKTTTIRGERDFNTIGLNVGEQAVVEVGGVDFVIRNRGKLDINQAGGVKSMLKSEGVKSVDEFIYAQTKLFFNNETDAYIYDIKPALTEEDSENLEPCKNKK